VHRVAVVKVAPVKTVNGDDEQFVPRILLRDGWHDEKQKTQDKKESTHLEADPPTQLDLT
jgi:hypothetical protein